MRCYRAVQEAACSAFLCPMEAIGIFIFKASCHRCEIDCNCLPPHFQALVVVRAEKGPVGGGNDPDLWDNPIWGYVWRGGYGLVVFGAIAFLLKLATPVLETMGNTFPKVCECLSHVSLKVCFGGLYLLNAHSCVSLAGIVGSSHKLHTSSCKAAINVMTTVTLLLVVQGTSNLSCRRRA